MVHADDSFRASLHVAPYDMPESSAPIYSERAYLPATETAPNRNYDFAPFAHKAAEETVVGKPVEPVATAVESVKKSVAPKREKTEAALPGTKPPKVGVNIEWIQKGVGWDCREVYYVGKQRRRRHLGHIGRQKWEEMQQQYQGVELEQVLSEWIEARRVEKSMSAAE
jgi:hypothetical protein